MNLGKGGALATLKWLQLWLYMAEVIIGVKMNLKEVREGPLNAFLV